MQGGEEIAALDEIVTDGKCADEGLVSIPDFIGETGAEE
jgi:hypothetical protein